MLKCRSPLLDLSFPCPIEPPADVGVGADLPWGFFFFPDLLALKWREVTRCAIRACI